jgi:phosphatidylglycerol:prolipoprotein diacylglycerol transferase
VIPYFTAFTIFGISAFGLLVNTGTALGSWLAYRRARARGVDSGEILGAIVVGLVTGFALSHLVDIFINHPERLAREGLGVLLKTWDGMDSLGGFAGAWIGAWLYLRGLKKSWFRHSDSVAESLVVAWVFGRLGCTLVHDHPGMRSDFFLAVKYPGGPRHDMGFEEFLFTLLVLLPLSLYFTRNHAKLRPGTSTVVLPAAYSVGRFFLDFLRARDLPVVDDRYWGLTDSQWACLGVLGLSLFVARKVFGERVRGG